MEGRTNAAVAEHDATPRPTPPKPPAPPADVIDAETGEVIDEREIVIETGEDTGALTDGEPFDPTAYFEELETSLAAETTAEGIEERWNEFDPLATFDGDDVNQGIAMVIKARRLKAIGG
jgi:hypothetical protein